MNKLNVLGTVTGRLLATIPQSGVTTGRLSSSEPATSNTPKAGTPLLDLDFSSIEQRIQAQQEQAPAPFWDWTIPETVFGTPAALSAQESGFVAAMLHQFGVAEGFLPNSRKSAVNRAITALAH